MIGAIENAIVARLKSASDLGLLGYSLKTVESYGGEFDADELAKAAAKLPGAFVLFLGDEQQRAVSDGRWEMKGTFAVLVGAKNKRNEAARRHGGQGQGEVGSWQMARDARTLLADQRLGLEIGYLVPTKMQPLPLARVGNDPLSLVTVEFETTYTLTGAPDAQAATGADGAALPPGALPPGLDPAAGLLANMGRAAGITDFAGLDADWDAPKPTTDTIDLETP